MLQENIFFVSLIFVFLFDYFSFSAVFSSAPVSTCKTRAPGQRTADLQTPGCPPRAAANIAAARPRTPGRPPRAAANTAAARLRTPGRPPRAAANAAAARPRTPGRPPHNRCKCRGGCNQPNTEPPPQARRQFTAGKAPTAPARTPRWRRCRSRSPARQWRTASRTFR